MEKGLVERLDAAVARLEVAIVSKSISFSERVLNGNFLPEATDPTIDELLTRPLHRVVTAVEKFGREVLEAMKILEKVFGVEKELLIKKTQTQVKAIPIQRWRRVGETRCISDQPDYRSLIKQKIQSLKASSSLSSPICFRCADSGHIARHCHNAVICFVCNRLGHRAVQCRAVTEFRFGTGNTNPTGTQVKRIGENDTSFNMSKTQHSICTNFDTGQGEISQLVAGSVDQKGVRDKMEAKSIDPTPAQKVKCIEQRAKEEGNVESVYEKGESSKQNTPNSRAEHEKIDIADKLNCETVDSATEFAKENLMFSDIQFERGDCSRDMFSSEQEQERQLMMICREEQHEKQEAHSMYVPISRLSGGSNRRRKSLRVQVKDCPLRNRTKNRIKSNATDEESNQEQCDR